MRDTSTKDRVVMMASAAVVIGAIFYGSLMRDSSMCYRVPVCPEIRSVLLR